jgi:hypothetical protein
MTAVVPAALTPPEDVAERSQTGPFSAVFSELPRVTAGVLSGIRFLHSHFDPGFFPRSRGAMDPVGWPGRWPAFGAIMRWYPSDHPP